jgi:hypothetical protein
MDKKTATETHLKYVQRWTEAVEARKYGEALSVLQEGLRFADEVDSYQITRHLRELERLTQGWLAYTNDEQRLSQIRGDYESRLSCSFCGRKRAEVSTLVAGPGVYICSECITAFSQMSASKGHTSDSPAAICSFCGKQVSEVERLIQGSGACICDGCLGVCGEILNETRNTSDHT